MATKTSVAFKQSIAHLQSAQPLFIKKMVEMITKRFTVWDRTSVYTVLEKIHFAIIITMLHAWLSWLTFPGVTINTEIRSNFCCWIFVNKKGDLLSDKIDMWTNWRYRNLYQRYHATCTFWWLPSFFLQETNVTNWNVLSMSNVYYVWFSESQALIYLKSIDMQTERQ